MRLAGYTVQQKLSSVANIVYARAVGPSGDTVLLKYDEALRGDPDIHAHWQYELSLLQRLDSEFIVKPYDLETNNHQAILVMQDFTAETLGSLIATGQLNFALQLKIATLLANGLSELHQSGLIHRNLNPENILFNRDSCELKIVNLAKATKLKWQRARVERGSLWGSAAYMAPELLGSGRVEVDYRSDFYSLGVILYQLFSSTKPFVSDDFVAMVQAQTNRLPEPLETLNNKIPRELSEIVQKLLSKSADDRYSSHHALCADLKDCEKQWQTKGQIDHFPIGQGDVGEQFCLSQRVYGREIEQTGLQAAFDQASSGMAELILIGGPAGVGKSTLVQQLHHSIVAKRGFFVSGRCEQYHRYEPYAALIAAFSSLLQQLLFESDERLRYWRGKLKSALGKNTAVIAEIIPDVALLTGDIPDLPELPPAETEKRLHITFGHFIQALSSSGHPLVVYINNLQWADDATLRLLAHQTVCNEKNAVLFIGAYRDDEIPPNHPLLSMIEKIELAQGRLKSIKLKPLARHQIQRIVSDSFGCSQPQAVSLGDEIYDRCNGEPFFAKQYLTALYHQGVVRFDHKQQQWHWSLEAIPEALDCQDSISLLTARCHRLDFNSQQLLALAAHIGHRFTLAKLASIYQHSLAETAQILTAVLDAEFLIALDDNCHFINDPQRLANASYRFKHDLHQQAAYQLISAKDRPRLQQKIGRLMLDTTPLYDLDNQLYYVLTPLNHARTMIVDPAEQARLLALNIRAGIMAKSVSAFSTAVSLLRIAKSLLVANAWQLFPNQTLTVYKELAEAEYLAGNFEQAEILYQQGLTHSTERLAKLTLYLVQSEQYQLQHKHQASITALCSGLALLENPLCANETAASELVPGMIEEVEHLLGSFETAKILALPEMVRLEQLVAMQLYFNLLADYTALGDKYSYGLCACQMVLITLNHGQCDISTIGFRAYMSVIAQTRENFERCYQLGNLAIELAEHRGNKYHRSSVYQVFASRYLHWREPLQNAFAYLQQVIKWGSEGISLLDACEACIQLNQLRTIKGASLPSVESSIHKSLTFIRQIGNKHAELQLLTASLQPVMALQGKAPNPQGFDHQSISLEKRRQGSDNTTQAMHICAMLRHGYLMNNRALQQQLVTLVDWITATLADSPLVTECYFYAALSHLGFAVPGESGYVENIKQAKWLNEKIKLWASQCPQNYLHKSLIVAAELARVSGDTQSADTLFDQAIETSEHAGFIHCEALANELFAKCWLHKNQSRVAITFIKEAHCLYTRWGALAKCELIEQQWPQVNFKYADLPADHYTATQNNTNNDHIRLTPATPLDIHALLKANQRLSQEIQKAPLIETLLTVMLEHTRAQNGAVIIDVDSQLLVESFGRFNPLDNKVQCQPISTTLAEICAESPPRLPSALIRYVQQTQEPLMLQSPVKDVRFSHNDYLQHFQPQGIVVMPIIGQGRILAIVYLENYHQQHEFTPAHLEILALLASQAAVSLLNALQFQNLQEKNAKRKAQLNNEREKADRANETKSLFLANMSHEIRTPLTTVIGFAEGMLFGDIDPKNHQQAIQTIASSGKHLLLLINDILDFSKIEAGQMQVEKISVNLIELLANLESVGLGLVKTKPIQFHLDLTAPLPDRISTDPTRLNQILLNLIANAVKFTEHGKVVLRVYPREQHLICEVEDTGVGIMSDKIDGLFFAFEQADKTVQRKYGGTGLGLTISKSLAQMLGGDIVCQSEVGKGSRFTVSIELVPCPEATLVDASNQLEQARQDQNNGERILISQLTGHILVAEDQPENLQLITTMLEKMGLTVTGVCNGQEAIEAFLVEDFDLILMDIQMPIMDGLETFDMLTSINNDTPVIALTANAMKHEVEAYFRKGFDEHLSKPIERKPFVEKISRFLGQEGAHIDASLSDEEMSFLQQQFSANLPAYLDRLAEHLHCQDWHSLQLDAHALKGAAGTLGFTELSKLAARVEQELKDKTITLIPEHVTALIACANILLEPRS